MNIFTGMVLLIFSYLQYNLWFSSTRVTELYNKKRTLQAASAENAELTQRINTLRNSIYHLRHQRCAIEREARYEMGMLYTDEYFYRVVKKTTE